MPAGRYVAGGVNVPLPAQASKETVQDGSSSGRYLAAYPRTHSGKICGYIGSGIGLCKNCRGARTRAK